MINDTEWMTRYLQTEADRVTVHDMLNEVELGKRPSPLVAEQRVERPRPVSVVMAAAAAVAILAVGVATLTRGSTPARENVSALQQGPDGGAGSGTIPLLAAAPTVETTTTVAAVTQLPDGGLWLGGQVPTCTKVLDDEYVCTLTEPWPGDVPGYDDSGYVEVYINSSSLIAGGCRATSADARRWSCYVGERAEQEGVVATYGDAKLGDWYPTGFVPG